MASTLVRLAFSRIFFGFHGDEVELLEEAFRALGWLEATPWGLRNLLVPRLLVAPALWSASRLGIADTAHLLWIATWPFVILASLNLLLVHRLAERWADRRAADLAVVLYACHWIPLSFGATAYPRTLAVSCVLLATLALDGRDRDVSRGLGAGALIALAFAARYSEAIYLAPLAWLAFAASRPRSAGWRRVIGIGIGFTTGAMLTVGLVDLLTWGRPFASLGAFAEYTLLERASSSAIQSMPAHWYARRLLHWVPLTSIPLLASAFATRGHRRSTLWLFAILPVLVLSFIHQKQLRYLQAVIPYLSILSAVGAAEMSRRGKRGTALALVASTCLWGLYGAPRHLAERPLAATAAARWIAVEEPGPKTVVVTQPWAFGGGLFLGPQTVLLDAGVDPLPADLTVAASDARWVALYEDLAANRPELVEAMERAGFILERSFRAGRSRSVVLFRRRPGSFEGAPGFSEVLSGRDLA